MPVISTFWKEDADGKAKADVVLNSDTYRIEYYDARGEHFRTEEFPGKSIFYVESAAENWAQGIKVLNG
jgi:hypothetical protein